ncbi:MAG: DHHW family protein, partial [Defluviitaleaceae bacterium]|nr:DHHW family protein [Defluviitaleaceae bacterium]
FVLILPSDENAPAFENRAMETFPAFSFGGFLSGDFSKGVEAFLLDNTALRTSWLTFANIVEHSYGINRTGGAMMVEFDLADLGIGLVPDELPEETPFTATTQAENQTADAGATYERVHVITGGNVNPSVPFSVDIHFSPAAILYLRFREDPLLAARYAQVLNAYHELLPDNARMFSLISPVKVEFMGPRYAAVNSSQIDTINFINARLHADIITVDAHSILAAHSNEYLFFRTDHHWTMLGAYYAYLAFAEVAGFEPITIENYVEHAIEGFIGSLAVGTRNRTILSHPDTIYFYTLNDGTTFSINMFTIPSDLSTLSYRVFLGGDRAFYYFHSSNANGRTLVVVKDSFANAMIPWLAPHYETIVVIDPRQFTGSVIEVLQDFDDIDLLFVNYIPATTMPDLIEQIYNAR